MIKPAKTPIIPSYTILCQPRYRQNKTIDNPVQTAIMLTLWLGFVPRHNTNNKGAKALPIPDQAIITKPKTLWLLAKAQRSAPTVNSHRDCLY